MGRPGARLLSIPVALVLGLASAVTTAAPSRGDSATFAVIGDYGWCDGGEARVARMVAGWGPAWVVTAGDNYQNVSRCSAYSVAVDGYYGSFVAAQDFYPALGNHDYNPAAGLDLYNSHFSHLPTTADPLRRWYEVTRGDVHLYVIDSWAAQDSADAMAAQRAWLEASLSASTSAWDIVVFHHPAYSSVGSTTAMRWDFAAWGADAVISGHQHVYERIARDGIRYFTVGLGGLEGSTCPATRLDGSQACVGDSGAMRVAASPAAITFEYLVDDQVTDSVTLTSPGTPPPQAPPTPPPVTIGTGPCASCAPPSPVPGTPPMPVPGAEASPAPRAVGMAPEAAGAPAARVTARPRSGRSVLHVNVDPNRVKGHWTVEVQRRRADGTWRALRTYRTRGTSQTRTIDLRRGTYRVWVRANHGYEAAISAEVRLRR